MKKKIISSNEKQGQAPESRVLPTFWSTVNVSPTVTTSQAVMHDFPSASIQCYWQFILSARLDYPLGLVPRSSLSMAISARRATMRGCTTTCIPANLVVWMRSQILSSISETFDRAPSIPAFLSGFQLRKSARELRTPRLGANACSSSAE